MGSGTWSPDKWVDHTTRVADKPVDKIFTGSSMNADLDPHNFKVRESCDSPFNPESTALMVFADVTGSMHILAENLIKTGLGILFTEIRERKPVSDPHILVGAIGDVYSDNAPLQASQFEADIRIAEQTEKIYVEQGGGNNAHESYILAYYMAAFRTKIDCFLKRGKKGYMFTIGDEPPQMSLTPAETHAATGDSVQEAMSAEDLRDLAMKQWHCFHIIISQGNHVRIHGLPSVQKPWVKLLGQNAVVLNDIDKLPELIVSLIQVCEGIAADVVADSWNGGTALVIREALNGMTAAKITGGSGVATL